MFFLPSGRSITRALPFSMVGTSVQARQTSFQSAFQAVSGRAVMLLISDLASIELISGFQVPGDWVMPITSSSLARAGAASAVSARRTKRMRRIMSAAPSHDDARCTSSGAHLRRPP